MTTEGSTGMDRPDKRTLHSYEHFGMQKEWLAAFFAAPGDWVGRNSLGNRQFSAMILWLKHAELATSGRGTRTLAVTDLGRRLAQLGIGNPVTWAVLWTNLARNSSPVRWFLAAVPWGTTITKSECVAQMGQEYPQSESTRRNAMTALFGLLTKTPLGNDLGLGEETKSGRRVAGALYKKGWEKPDPSAVLYTLYRYAEKVGRHELTVRELYDGAPEGPFTLFGIRQAALEGILRGLSTRGDGLIRVDIIRDLDNIFLAHDCRSLDIITG
jgi:phosphoadenosine phosphosulfate reductase